MSFENNSPAAAAKSSEPAEGRRGLLVGLTYDLRSHYLAQGYSEEETAEFDSPATVEAIAGALSELGHQPDPIGNSQELTRRLVAGERWDLVFNIAEGLNGLGRESLIPALLDSYRIPYTFSDPCVMAICLHKGFAKNILRDCGLSTPGFALIRQEADLESLDLSYPLFAKPVAEGTGKGVSAASKVDNPRQLRSLCLDLLARFRQPVLVEEYLPGREFTVGILGSGERAAALGTLEVIILEGGEQGAYSYVNKEKCEELVEYRLVRDRDARAAEEVSVAAWRALGCRDGGRIDLRLGPSGHPSIIELNPLAGLHPTHSDLPMIATAVGISYRELIGRIVASALQRARPHNRESALQVQALPVETSTV